METSIEELRRTIYELAEHVIDHCDRLDAADSAAFDLAMCAKELLDRTNPESSD